MPEHIQPRWTEPSTDSPVVAAAYDDLVAEAESGAPLYARAFRARVVAHPDGWSCLTDLDDDFHSIRIALRLAGDGTVMRAAGRMVRHPYATCPRGLDAIPGLAGVNLFAPGVMNEMKSRLPRDAGCIHAIDMLAVTLRAFRTSRAHDMEGYSGEETRLRLMRSLPILRDSCASFATEHPGT